MSKPFSKKNVSLKCWTISKFHKSDLKKKFEKKGKKLTEKEVMIKTQSYLFCFCFKIIIKFFVV